MSDLIYVVEDEENIRELICVTLHSAGYSTVGFESAEALYDQLTKELPTLILLDIMLPKESGMDTLKHLKRIDEYKQVPVIFLTAKSTELDKVQGLNMGADDFIVKPFGVLELIARVSAVLRRCSAKSESLTTVPYKDLIINPDEKAIYKNDIKIPLTFKEYELFLFLHKNKGIVLTREKLLEQIWDFTFDGETRTVDAHVRSLRSKLDDNSDEPNYIATIRGHGYMLMK